MSELLEVQDSNIEELDELLMELAPEEILDSQPQNTESNEEATETEQTTSIAEELNQTQETDADRLNKLVNLLEENENTTRFRGATWFEEIQKSSITIAGLGGIGSWVAFMISRLNPKGIILWDPDIVERVNMAGQFFQESNIYKPKNDAVYENIKNFSGYRKVISFNEEITLMSPLNNIVIGGFDNMYARETLFRGWLKHVNNNRERAKDCLFIDGRLNAEEFQIFSFTGEDKYLHDVYRMKWLFNDLNAEETTCSYKQTSYCANMIASFITNIVVNFFHNKHSKIPRPIPFMTRYSGETMFLNISV